MNLLKETAKVVKAMTILEGSDWLLHQFNPERDYTLSKSVKRLLDECGHPYGIIIQMVYGRDGWHRYGVCDDGEILFSAYHADEKAKLKAQSLGFTLY